MHAGERLEALMGEGGVAGLRQGAELRRGLSEGDPARRLDRRGLASDDQAHALRLAPQVRDRYAQRMGSAAIVCASRVSRRVAGRVLVRTPSSLDVVGVERDAARPSGAGRAVVGTSGTSGASGQSEAPPAASLRRRPSTSTAMKGLTPTRDGPRPRPAPTANRRATPRRQSAHGAFGKCGESHRTSARAGPARRRR